jgi:hypothetical protein
VGTTVAIRSGGAGPTQTVAGTFELHAVACGSADTCEAVGHDASDEGVVVTIRDGVPGIPRVVAGSSDLTGIACPSARSCWAVGRRTTGPVRASPLGVGVVAAISRGLPSPAVAIAGSGALTDVACPTAAGCEAVGAATSAGATIGLVVRLATRAVQPVSGSSALNGIACPTAASCIAVGAGRRDASSAWGVVVPVTRGIGRRATGVPGSSALGTVACAAVTRCEAAGSGLQPPVSSWPPSVAVPVSAGAPGPARVLPTVTYVADLACVSTSVCQALSELPDGRVGLTPLAPPAAFGCTASSAGFRAGTLRLRTGTTCLSGLALKGSILVGRGASLDIEQAKITGAIIATGPSRIRICGATIGGSVKVAAAGGVVQIGDPGRDGCTVNRITGSLTLEHDTHGVFAVGNRVRGRVTASGNHRAVAGAQIADNNLRPAPCTSREPPIVATSWAAGQAVLAPTGAIAMRLCRYAAGEPLGPPTILVSSRLLTDVRLVKELTRGFDLLPPTPRDRPFTGRPADGSEIVAQLAYPDGHAVALSVDFAGCAFVDSGAVFAVASGFDGHYGPQLVAQLVQLTGGGPPIPGASLYIGCPF